MKKYDAQKVQAKFEKKWNKVAQKLDRADKKGRELSIIFLRCKIAKMANSRARQMEKFETNGIAVKPELIFGKEYCVNFKVRKDEMEALSPEEAERICANNSPASDKIYDVFQSTATKSANHEKSL